MANLETAPPQNDALLIAEVQPTPEPGAIQSFNAPDFAAAGAAEASRQGAGDAKSVPPARVGEDEITFPADTFTGGKSSDKLDPHVEAAVATATEMNTVGWSARGVRLALERAGETNVPRGHAAEMGAALAASGKYDIIPFTEANARPGDILVRPWSQAQQNATGSSYGDIMTITGRNADGSLRGANDHIVNRVAPEGTRYEGSYLLRRKG